MSEYTKGEWRFELDRDYAIVFIEDAGTIAEISNDLKSWPANARLIAAAPDLLEACKDALKNMDNEAVQCNGDWQTGLFCGLEDINITDRYEACIFGYEKALEKVREWVLCGLEATIAKAEKE